MDFNVVLEKCLNRLMVAEEGTEIRERMDSPRPRMLTPQDTGGAQSARFLQHVRFRSVAVGSTQPHGILTSSPECYTALVYLDCLHGNTACVSVYTPHTLALVGAQMGLTVCKRWENHPTSCLAGFCV